MATYQNVQSAAHPGAGEAAPAAAASLAAIWSRNVDFDKLAGRPRMILAVRRAMTEACSAEHLHLCNLLERRSLGAVLWAACSAAGELLRGRLPSLQCLLYADGGNHRNLRARLRHLRPTTLYCDGVRSYYFLRRLGAARDHMRIIVDLDDLMSRRMELLGQSGVGLSLGYLHQRAPAWVIRLLRQRLVASLVTGWEGLALRQVEDDMGRWAHAVVLLSPVEGAALHSRYLENQARARVLVIPPPTEISAPPQAYSRFERFILIGTDTLPQNHSTIERLIDLWARLRPSPELHIFGSMSHRWPEIAGVVFRGYTPDLAEVYTEGSVLLAPGALRGGIKTKVIEAFANGCAVAGNSITFEGLELEDYPLRLDDVAKLEELVLHPEAYLDVFRHAAVSGQDYIAKALGWSSFSAAWRATFGFE